MTNRDLLEQQTLSRDELIALRNKRTGVTIFQISWIMVFVCLIVVNLQIRSNFVVWPPVGVDELNRALPTVATLALLISSVAAYLGLRALRQSDRVGMLNNWRVALVLGVAFIAIMALEWVAVPFSEQYSTVFRVMTAFHALHALAIGLIMVQVYRTALAGGYDLAHHWAVEASVKLWYFVTVAWIMFYVVLYII